MINKPPYPDAFVSDCITLKVLQNHLTVSKSEYRNKLSLKTAKELNTWLNSVICYLDYYEKQCLKFEQEVVERREV